MLLPNKNFLTACFPYTHTAAALNTLFAPLQAWAFFKSAIKLNQCVFRVDGEWDFITILWLRGLAHFPKVLNGITFSTFLTTFHHFSSSLSLSYHLFGSDSFIASSPEEGFHHNAVEMYGSLFGVSSCVLEPLSLSLSQLAPAAQLCGSREMDNLWGDGGGGGEHCPFYRMASQSSKTLDIGKIRPWLKFVCWYKSSNHGRASINCGKSWSRLFCPFAFFFIRMRMWAEFSPW